MKTLAPLICAAVLAQPAWSQLVASFDDDNRVNVYRMMISPAEQPTPRLRYRLTTADLDQRPGNAATFWYRAVLDRRRVSEWVREQLGKELLNELDENDPAREEPLSSLGHGVLDAWRDPQRTLLDDLPVERAKKALGDQLGGGRRTHLLDASQRRSCAWNFGLPWISGPEAAEFMLPEFQEFRDMSRDLCLEARVAIAEGRFGEALDSLRINQELAADAARPPFMVCRLIGLACTGYGGAVIRELQCQPETPSLYWALAELPRPLVDFREAIRFESGIGPRMFELINAPKSADRSDTEWDRLLSECLGNLLEQTGYAATRNPPSKNAVEVTELSEWIESLRDAGRDHPGVRLAESRLLARGYTPEEFKAMPTAKVLAIDAAHAYHVVSDAIEAAAMLPWPEGAGALESAEQLLQAADPLGDAAHREVLPIAGLYAASTNAAIRGAMLRERQMTALRLVAALRLHAGATGGLPDSLDDVTVVPVPRDPMTGGSFNYRLEGDTAVINLAAPKSYGWGERYEITLAE